MRRGAEIVRAIFLSFFERAGAVRHGFEPGRDGVAKRPGCAERAPVDALGAAPSVPMTTGARSIATRRFIMPCSSSIDWRDQLAPGHVVSFAFPFAERARDAGERPKRRPCLVIAIDRSGAAPTATLAYGTGATTAANVGLELHVIDAAARRAAGVRKPTRFVGARRATVDLEDAAFALNAEGTPILGSLDAAGVERLHAIRSVLAAAPDKVPARGGERRRRRGGRRRRVAFDQVAANF